MIGSLPKLSYNTYINASYKLKLAFIPQKPLNTLSILICKAKINNHLHSLFGKTPVLMYVLIGDGFGYYMIDI
jgi:hypothetical protein